VKLRPAWLLAALVFAIVLGRVAWVRANEKHVEISVDGATKSLVTMKKTVGEALAEAQVTLGPADEITPAASDRLEKQQKIAIIRAVPVQISVDGGKSDLLTTRKNVKGVLEQAGVALGEMDKIKPALEGEVTSGLVIEITRVKEDLTTQRVSIAFATQRRDDETLELGLTKVVQAGVNGIRELKYRVTYENGKKIKSVLVSSKVIKEPVTKIVAYGTAGAISRGGQTVRFKRAYEMTATAYYPGPESTGKWADGYTSIGMKAAFGVVAVDPKVIPLRSRLYVDGYGFAIAGDVGSAIKGLRIDLCYDTLQEALNWGRRKTKVYVLAD
jgi:uncharacterized protein YabE (DUF348 family)/3D (Asp-Asp-Asp) domain-containing protein